MTVPLTDEQINELRNRMRSGQKLAAVRQHKEWTGSSLRDAKAFVESLGVNRNADEGDPFAIDDAQMDRILDALESGRKLDAVKIYKEATGTQLMDSKKFIEQLMNELQIEDRGAKSCGMLLLLMVAGAAAAWLINRV